MFGNTYSISRISLHSGKHSSALRKNSPSTQPQESPEQDSSHNEAWQNEQSSLHFHKLCDEIERMERSQEEMERKYRRYIEHMLAEIEKNNDNNARLAAEVSTLRGEVDESRKDILIIDEYLRTNLKRDNPKQNTPTAVEKRAPSRDLLGSCSRSKNLLTRRTPGKLFKSKLTIKA